MAELCFKAGMFLRTGKDRSTRLMLFVLIANDALHCHAGKCADVRHCRHRGTNTHALWQNIQKQKRRAKDWRMKVTLVGDTVRHRLAVFGNSVHDVQSFCDMGTLQLKHQR